jgi:hypothetical protein
MVRCIPANIKAINYEGMAGQCGSRFDNVIRLVGELVTKGGDGYAGSLTWTLNGKNPNSVFKNQLSFSNFNVELDSAFRNHNYATVRALLQRLLF